MGILSNRITKESLQPGDHIYSWRRAYIYAHHGIYAGDGMVIHFTRGRNEELGTGTFLDALASSSRPGPTATTCQVCGINPDSCGVIRSCLDCFLVDCPLYRFEYGTNLGVFLAKARGGTCTLARSDCSELVLHRANYLLNNGFGCYHIFHNNCEDFAIYCKTGLLVIEGNTIGRSGQAISFLGVPFSAVASTPLRFLMTNPWGLVAITAGVYTAGRYAADLGVRSGIAKVDVEDLAVNLGWQTGRLL